MAALKEISQHHKMIHVLNPFTQAIIDTIQAATICDVEKALLSALRGLALCRALPWHQRASILLCTANVVREQQEGFATLIVQKAGKTIVQARKEVSRCINTLEFSAEAAKRLTGEVIPFDAYEGAMGRQGYTHCDPLVIIVAITPFNDPLNVVAYKLRPAVAGGNAIIL